MSRAALILDAHYTPDERPRHRGRGHSDWRQCVQFAKATNAGGLWLFHHKPGRTDDELVRIRADARRVFSATETSSEGDVFQF
jgi:ribonuclease BN (tRNA processing enzyme)